MEGRRQERRLERPPAQGRRWELCAIGPEKCSVESWRRLRYPWAQSSPKTGEETTGLEDRTQAPSKRHRAELPPAASGGPSQTETSGQGGRPIAGIS